MHITRFIVDLQFDLATVDSASAVKELDAETAGWRHCSLSPANTFATLSARIGGEGRGEGAI